jgi:lysophospholipid acyltransferase (LPLAT)-like uncharacterized protein
MAARPPAEVIGNLGRDVVRASAGDGKASVLRAMFN